MSAGAAATVLLEAYAAAGVPHAAARADQFVGWLLRMQGGLGAAPRVLLDVLRVSLVLLCAAPLEAKLQALKALDLAAVADDVAQNRTGAALPGDLGAARHRLLSHADVAAQVKAVRAFHQGSWVIPFSHLV